MAGVAALAVVLLLTGNKHPHRIHPDRHCLLTAARRGDVIEVPA